MAEFKKGDLVRGYTYDSAPSFEVVRYSHSSPTRPGHYCIYDNRYCYFDRVEKVDNVVESFKKGDKVKVYDHIGEEVPDGVEGVYESPWGGRHSVDVGNRYGKMRIFGRVEKVDDVVESFNKGDKVLVDDADFAFQNEVAKKSSDYYLYDMPNGYEHFVYTPGGSIVLVKKVRKFEETLESYKQRVLKVLDEKNEKYKWCDEYEQTLKALDITRPLPDLPTAKNALIEVTSGGSKSTWRRHDVHPQDWVDANGFVFSTVAAQKRYVRTIFEGEK